MEISVLPDMSVIIKAPLNTDTLKIEAKLKKRARWILKQQAYFNQFHPRITERYYLSGETHFYLGKRYQLKVTESNEKQDQLKNGSFCITTPDTSQSSVKKLMLKWYRQKAKEQFQESFERCWSGKLSKAYEKPKIQIKQMQKRWGSLSPTRILTLNIELIKAPKECIDYVVTHELCHLTYPNHTKEFYQLLEEQFPNWKSVKHKLEILMS
jgi:predicted metal-dependent hydrolase